MKLGVMYAMGRGIPKDEAHSVKWFREAAEQGDAFAQVLLGKMYSDGVGVPKDETEAVKWHQKAAEQGEDNAQNELTIHYMHGRGVPINLVIAYKWALLAAAKGNEYAGKNMLKLEDYLTPEQMEEGRKMASEFEERKPTKN